MMSVAMLSTGLRAFASAMSPEKNPCRVRIADEQGCPTRTYRYDPYACKVMPSPMKTSPVKSSSSASYSPAAMDAAPLHRNSLFSAPVVVTAPTPISFLAAAENRAVAPAPVATEVFTKRTPTAAATTKTHYAVIHFKHDSGTFVAPFRIKSGDHVIVEGDRGVDIGIVSELSTETPSYPVPLKIVRRATSSDMEAFQQKQRKEQLVQCQVQTLSESLNLGIKIVDTEFQFDNNKLTIFFSGRAQIDFRKLQRGLFREHRCRIWLSNMAEVEYNANLQKVRRTR